MRQNTQKVSIWQIHTVTQRGQFALENEVQKEIVSSGYEASADGTGTHGSILALPKVTRRANGHRGSSYLQLKWRPQRAPGLEKLIPPRLFFLGRPSEAGPYPTPNCRRLDDLDREWQKPHHLFSRSFRQCRYASLCSPKTSESRDT